MNIAALKSLVLPKINSTYAAAREEWETRRFHARRERCKRELAARKERNRQRRRESQAQRERMEAELLRELGLPRTALTLLLVRYFSPIFVNGRLVWLQLFKPFNHYPAF